MPVRTGRLFRQGELYTRRFFHRGFGYGFQLLHYNERFIDYLGRGFRLIGSRYLAAAE